MLAAQIELILLITGLATAGALVVFLAPVTMSKTHWGLLVFLVGALLVYAAYHAEIRVPTLIVAIVEKVAIAFGMFISPFRRRPAVVVMALADAGMAAVYLMYLSGL
jgi:hypothetical protein